MPQAMILALMGVFLSACGYSLQGSHDELLQKEGIHRIYVQPIQNDTYKAGIENVVYNALVKTLVTGGRVTLVKDPALADAVLIGRVGTAASAISGSNTMNYIGPENVYRNPQIVVATLYNATLNCSFNLVRRNPAPGRRPTVWGSAFSRTKSYPAAIQLDVPGTTSSLINESEFDRALGDLAGPMMQDLHESMLAMF